MIVSRQVAAPDRGLEGPCPRFGSAVHHGSNASVHERADAHQAGLNGHVERGAGEAVVADRSRRLPYRHDLSMGGWIVGTDGLVESTDHDDVAENDNRTNRNFSGLVGKARLIQRLSHEPL